MSGLGLECEAQVSDMPENRRETEKRRKVKFRKGQSGNPGARPKVLGEVQELARQYAPKAIAELARLARRQRVGHNAVPSVLAPRLLLLCDPVTWISGGKRSGLPCLGE